MAMLIVDVYDTDSSSVPVMKIPTFFTSLPTADLPRRYQRSYVLECIDVIREEEGPLSKKPPFGRFRHLGLRVFNIKQETLSDAGTFDRCRVLNLLGIVWP